MIMTDPIEPSHLKLVKPPSGPSDVLFLERRLADRLPTIGDATALITDDSDPKQPARKICNVKLANISETGLGVIVREPVPTGNHITVFIQPHGPEAGKDVTGTIVRCTKHELGYDIGIKTPSRILAA
jgi:PilZ domain-containing protein